MAGKICRCTIFAFMYPEWDVLKGETFDNSDLENGIQYCQEYLDEGFKVEGMDGFDLQNYIEWAKVEILK